MMDFFLQPLTLFYVYDLNRFYFFLPLNFSLSRKSMSYEHGYKNFKRNEIGIWQPFKFSWFQRNIFIIQYHSIAIDDINYRWLQMKLIRINHYDHANSQIVLPKLNQCICIYYSPNLNPFAIVLLRRKFLIVTWVMDCWPKYHLTIWSKEQSYQR